MQVAVVSETPPDERNEAGRTLREAKTVRQSLLADDTPHGLNFTLNRTQWLPGENATTTPRHHHAFQQVRWSESGRLNYAPGRYINEGDLGYFPRGAWYGPQLRDEGVSITIQFGFHGEKQHGSLQWDRYQAAYQDMIRHTSSAGAPWYVVPADRKWFARVVIGSVIVSALERLNLQFPTVDKASLEEFKKVRVALENEGKGPAKPVPKKPPAASVPAK